MIVVDDQIGSPTFTIDLAKAFVALINQDARGMFHITNSGYCSWFDYAKTIVEMAGIEGVIIEPITSDQYPGKAQRPKNSRMDCRKFEQVSQTKMPHYREALKEYLKGINV